MLMTLDFVLAQSKATYYVTDEDKAALLTEAGLAQNEWPCRRLDGRRASAHVRTRAFAENMPWYRQALSMIRSRGRFSYAA